MKLSNYHTHTRYCDGKDSPEELIQEAIRLGCPEIGFSGHAHVSFDDCCMSYEGTEAYIREIRTLQQKYRDQIRVYLGVEQDFYSDTPTDPYDYVIGAVHYLYKDGRFAFIDDCRETQMRSVQEFFHGDYYAFAEEYYATVAQLYEKTNCTVIAHFDLAMKYNEARDLFDPEHPRYRKAALNALRQLMEKPVIFEINTGGICRGYRSEAYPQRFLLETLEEAGAPTILASDCHDKKNLLFGFDQFQGRVKGLRERLFTGT